MKWKKYTSWSKNTDEPSTIASLMKQYTGKTRYWKFATLSGSANGIGNMVLSRFPLDASEPRLLSSGRSALNIAITANGRTINFTSTDHRPLLWVFTVNRRRRGEPNHSRRSKATSDIIWWLL